MKISAFNDLHMGWIENGVETMRLFTLAIRQRKMYRSLEFFANCVGQLLYRIRVPRAELIARWLTVCKKRAAQQPNRTQEMGRLVLQ